MTFLMLALLPAAVAMCLLVALALSIVIRAVRGERWSTPMEDQGNLSPNLQANNWMPESLAGNLVRESVA